MSKRYSSLAVVVLSATITAACGSNAPNEAATSGAAPAGAAAVAATASAPAPVVADGRSILITADDSMKFSAVEITAKPGERLSVSLTNKGATPKFSMGHNWMLLKSTVDLDAFLAESAASSATEYVPPTRKSEIIAATKLLGPGETDIATFDAPTVPGRYPFVCSFAGHAQLGMKGVLIVK